MDWSTFKMAFGNVNLERATTNVTCLRVQAPFQRSSAADTGKRDLRATVSVPSGKSREMGSFRHDTVSHPYGTVVMLMSTALRRGVTYAQGTLFLRLREGAPLISIHAKLPVNHATTLGSEHEVFRGHADILTARDLDILGFTVPNRWRKTYMVEEELEELFKTTVLSKGKIDRPQLMSIATSEGTEVVAIAKAPVRVPRRSV